MAWAEEQWWFGLEDLALEQEERQREANNYARQLINYGLWIGKGGKKIYAINSMEETHIKNCIKMIEDGRLDREWALPYLNNELKKRNNNDSKN